METDPAAVKTDTPLDEVAIDFEKYDLVAMPVIDSIGRLVGHITVDEHVFNPPPKVKSGVIKMVRNDVTDLGCDQTLFRTVVKTTFGQRRKTIRNSVKPLFPGGAPLPDSPLLALRPEQLSVAQFVELTNLVAAAKQALV